MPELMPYPTLALPLVAVIGNEETRTSLLEQFPPGNYERLLFAGDSRVVYIGINNVWVAFGKLQNV